MRIYKMSRIFSILEIDKDVIDYFNSLKEKGTNYHRKLLFLLCCIS